MLDATRSCVCACRANLRIKTRRGRFVHTQHGRPDKFCRSVVISSSDTESVLRVTGVRAGQVVCIRSLLSSSVYACRRRAANHGQREPPRSARGVPSLRGHAHHRDRVTLHVRGSAWEDVWIWFQSLVVALRP